jgi:mannan endo-1,4-beta-mannosidase
MPWYGDYTMDGWAHDNTAADWNSIMNNNYVITLDKMPGWAKFAQIHEAPNPRVNEDISIRYAHGSLDCTLTGTSADKVELFNVQGDRVATLTHGRLGPGAYRFRLNNIIQGIYFVRSGSGTGSGRIVASFMVSGK